MVFYCNPKTTPVVDTSKVTYKTYNILGKKHTLNAN